uniref:Uncharacterized protein n=1 Tax=Neovison vison TaxID=452646 RepID=A0A8C7BM88_NEOVI
MTPFRSGFHTWFCIPELHQNPHQPRNRERLAKWLATVSLSVTLASLACRPSSCPNISNGRHRNPAGWPGLVGRGLLGWWGPNQAEDLILTKCQERKLVPY